MTPHIANLQNLRSFGTFAAVTLGVNVASCQLSKVAWFATREAFNLACGISLACWNSQPLALVFQHVGRCPIATLDLFRCVLHAVSAAF